MYVAESCVEVRFAQLWVNAISSTKISEASVVTRLSCGGTFNCGFTRNLLLVKEF